MKSLNDYFDKIYCIHLDGYEDRKKCIDDVASKLNCDIEVFNAYTPSDCNLPPNMGVCLPTEYACSMSHIKLWEKILEDNPKRPLILEDDVIVNVDVDAFALLDRVRSSLLSEDTDIAFLGLNYRSHGKFCKISDDLFKVQYAYALHAYSPSMKAVKNLSILFAEDKLYSNPRVLDYKMAQIYHLINAITIAPSILYQKRGFSVIQNRELNYEGWLK